MHEIWNSGTLLQGYHANITSILAIGDTNGDGHPELAVLQGTSLHILELTPSLPLRFDFNASFNANGNPGPSPTQAAPLAYTAVVSTPYSPTLGYGWLGKAPGNYDRGAATLIAPASGAPDFRSLLEAFNDGGDNTFRVDLPAGTTYTATVTMGDTRADHGPVDVFTVVNGSATRVTSITLGDGSVVSSLTSRNRQFLTGSFQITAPAGSGLQPVQLEFKPEAGAVDFVINALDIRPTQAPLTLTATAPIPTSVNGQLVPLVTVSGSGATPNALVTVGSSLGILTAADQEPNFAGIQVLADSGGNFTFTAETITPGPVTFSAQEVDGASFGNTTETVVPPLHLAFTAPYDASNPGQVSPTQPGYLRVDQGQTFDGSFGWQAPVVSFDRNSTQLQQPTAGVPNYLDLLQAGHYGNNATFQASLPNGHYFVTLTVGDGALAHNNITATANGTPVTFTLGDGSTATVLSSPPHQFLTATFGVTISNGVGGANGLLALSLNKDSNYAYDNWVLNALDIRQAQGLSP